jgi:murein DD-endopeptidase MepM/ murein hydrolase activator NlpD
LKNGLRAAAEGLLSQAAHALEHHPKQVTAVIALLLLGAGSAAVASLDPPAELPPARQVIEAIATPHLAAQAEALDAFSFSLYRTELTRSSDTVESLLARLGLNDPAAAAYLRNDPTFRARLLRRAGQSVTVESNDRQSLVKLVARWSTDDTTFQRLVISRDAQGQLATSVESAPLVPALRLGSGTIYSSLFGAVDEAHIPDAVALQMADIFSGTIDFHRGLRRGDRFSVLYEALEADGEPLRTGRVVSADFTNAGKPFQAIWFQEPGKKGAYFDFNGKSLERAFLASPMEVSRITSGFSMRFHPILHTWRAHTGVDYGAPTGAPVRSIGDGVVSFAGVQNGYGNAIMIDHGKGDVTLYGHLSRIDVKRGQSVTRGQHIGAVGQTGWATGPHLHFEFRENGVFKDPLQVVRQSEAVELSAQARPQFNAVVSRIRTQLAAVAAVSAQVAAR